MDISITNLKPAPIHYQALVNRLLQLAEMKHSLHVYETYGVQAWATHHNNSLPVIAYNPKFMSRANASGKWAVIAIFAGEVAYHFNMDFFGKYISSYYNIKVNRPSSRKRLNTDYFVGRALRHEGATLEEAVKVIELLKKSDSSHYDEKRKEKFVDGWKAADALLKNLEIINKKKPGTPSSDFFQGLN